MVTTSEGREKNLIKISRERRESSAMTTLSKRQPAQCKRKTAEGTNKEEKERNSVNTTREGRRGIVLKTTKQERERNAKAKGEKHSVLRTPSAGEGKERSSRR